MCISLLVSPLLCLNWWSDLVVKDRQHTFSWRGVPRGGPGHLPRICGELPRASALKGVNVTPQPISSLYIWPKWLMCGCGWWT
jgi:hypothetical protein